MKFASLCSGIEAASVAWLPLGWECVWVSEIDAFPCAVLEHHYPGVPNLGDMTAGDFIARALLGHPLPDVLVGGTPCQSFSVAGLRKGLADERGNLTMRFVEIANVLQPKIIIWENVPGVLSDRKNAFGCFLAGLVGDEQPVEPGPRPGLGRTSAFWRTEKKTGRQVPKWPNAGLVVGPSRAAAWRILDAQYFGLAQRRRRVFVVACPVGGADPAKILFEFEGVRRDSPPSREAGKRFATDVTPSLTASGKGVARCGKSRGQDHVVAFGGNSPRPLDVATARNAHGGPHGRLDFESETLCVHGTQDPCFGDRAFALGRNNGGENAVFCNDVAPSIFAAGPPYSRTGNSRVEAEALAVQNLFVRRLMPVECERLQGFPDDYTQIPWRGKPPEQCPDGPRYKAIGNSMAVPVMRWIGERISRELKRN